MSFSTQTSMFFLLTVAVLRVSAFDRDVCLNTTLDLLRNNTMSPFSPFFFRDSSDSAPYNGADNMTLTLDGCYAICGPQQSWYVDIGPRLTVWLLPVLLLLFNVDIGPLDKRTFKTLLHLLGDPIDGMWSLLHKLDAWDRCFTFAARYRRLCPSCNLVVASVLAGYEEVQGPRIESESTFDSVLTRLDLSTGFREWRIVAAKLADGRGDELGRTVLALILYGFNITTAFATKLGGSPTSPPGGRIATVVLLSWLVPIIFISNAVGSLPSSRAAYSIMREFAASTGDQSIMPPVSLTEHVQAQQWSGGIYMYRPWKLRYITSTRYPHIHTLTLVSLAAAPVLIGVLGGILILWYQPPVGFNCRHFWLIGVGVLWLISTILTVMIQSHKAKTQQNRWRLVLFKDACIAIPSILIMFLSVCGLFNFCWCWSGVLQHRGRARVPLLNAFYLASDKSVYPLIVGLSMLLQILVVVAIRAKWQRGLQLMRWSQPRRQQEWQRIENGSRCGCVPTMQATSKSETVIATVREVQPAGESEE